MLFLASEYDRAGRYAGQKGWGKTLVSLKSKDKEYVLLVEGTGKQVDCFGSRIFYSDERTTSALLAPLIINNDSPAFRIM